MLAAVKRPFVRLALRLAYSGPGRRLVNASMRMLLKLSVDLAPAARFARVEAWPASIRGFDDLSFLFTSTQLDAGIAQLTFAEGAYLYRAAATTGPGTLVEIGRYKGGSTLIIAAAMHPEARLVSYDIHGVADVSGEELDAELRAALARYGLADRVELVVADSQTAETPGECALLFVDGDHSYVGVRADYEHWRGSLRAGGHLLFHDASPRASALEGGCEPVARAVDEIERSDVAYFSRTGQAGTIAHFVRTDVPLPRSADERAIAAAG